MRIRGFGELEAVIVDRIWSRGPATPTTVRELLDELACGTHHRLHHRDVHHGQPAYQGLARAGTRREGLSVLAHPVA